jgi:3-isopropylmalate/(R)-2-methylmalate dehydratase small subunit
MTPFTRFTAAAVRLDAANIDTDQIIPARFLRKPRSAGYQNFLFHDLRREHPHFPLNTATEPVGILLAGANFGCGSSREGAVYALTDAGIRCVIAPSFGDIFASNAAKNGLLTITLPAEKIAELTAARLTINLPAQQIIAGNAAPQPFDIDAYRKHCLIEGLDDIGLTLTHETEIADWFTTDRKTRPWASPRPL